MSFATKESTKFVFRSELWNAEIEGFTVEGKTFEPCRGYHQQPILAQVTARNSFSVLNFIEEQRSADTQIPTCITFM